MKSKIKNKGFNARLSTLYLFILLGFVIIIGRLFYIQIIKGKEYKDKAERQYKSDYVVKSKRGRIVSEDGEILAYDSENYSITLDPTLIELENIDKLLALFKENIKELDVEKTKNELIERKKNNEKYMKIRAYIDYNIKKSLTETLSNNISLKSGVFFETNFIRNYIKNNAFQELIGYLDNENKGVYGIEKFYDEKLSGVDGLIEGVRTNRNFLSLAAIRDTKEAISARDGYNAILTIDSVMQYSLDDEMRATFNEYSPESTMGIIIEVETGKIVAMSSYPKARNNAEVKNRPITDLFEPGSIFKPVTVAMGLNSKAINENSTIQSSGSIKVADRIIRDHDGSTIGTLTLERLVAHSGNVGMVRIAQMIKGDKFYEYLSDIGFGVKTGIDTFSESTQKLFERKDMTEIRKANISFGQGIAMTQIQMLMALNTVINDGKMVKPYLVDRFVDSDGNIVHQNTPTIVKTVFDEQTSRLNRQYMEAVVSSGTGRGVKIPGYRIGGKTGTAQKSGRGGYEAGKYFSSFFAFFPADKPKYAILVTVNEPKGAYYGAAVALPPVKSIIEKLIKFKGITPEGIVQNKQTKVETVNKEASTSTVVNKDMDKIAQELNNGTMPNIIGLSFRELLSVFPMEKYPKVKINGSGRVISQYPATGTKLNTDSTIRIDLK